MCHPSICIHTDVRHEVIYKRDTTVRSHDSVSNVSWAVSHICKIYSLIFHTPVLNNLAPSMTTPWHAVRSSNHVLHLRQMSPRCDSVHTFFHTGLFMRQEKTHMHTRWKNWRQNNNQTQLDVQWTHIGAIMDHWLTVSGEWSASCIHEWSGHLL